MPSTSSIPRVVLRLPTAAGRPLFAAVSALVLAGCSPPQAEPPDGSDALPRYTAFSDPQPVAISDYDGDAMQPFISPDGRFLLFNNRVDPREDTQLMIAENIDGQSFLSLGEMVGVNSKSLDSSASLDRDGNLYFISGRSYNQDYSTVYRGRFNEGEVSAVTLAPGISEHKPGRFSFDASISPDGNTLLLVDGHLGKGSLPDQAEIGMAVRAGETFRRVPPGQAPFAAINTPGTLNYAPTLSADGLELFFTRLVTTDRSPAPVILRAARSSVREAFGPPQRVAAIEGHAEAPSLSTDGTTLYFARRDTTHFSIYRVTRKASPAPSS